MDADNTLTDAEKRTPVFFAGFIAMHMCGEPPNENRPQGHQH